MKNKIIIAIISGLILFACKKEDSKQKETVKIDKSIIATINNTDIPVKQFESYLKYKRIPAKDEKRRSALLDQYLEREALSAVIESQGYLDQEQIDTELNEFRKEMLISRYFEKFLKEKVSDEAVRNYYVTNEKEYQERKVRVAHILLRTNRNMGETERQAKLTTAHAAYSQIKTGKEFVEVTTEFSEDTVSARKGGELGWLKEGSIDGRFSEKVFSMKAGDLSEPFETSFGYHIVKMLEGPVIVKRPLEAVIGDIRYQLRNKAKEAELKRLVGLGKIRKR